MSYSKEGFFPTIEINSNMPGNENDSLSNGKLTDESCWSCGVSGCNCGSNGTAGCISGCQGC